MVGGGGRLLLGVLQTSQLFVGQSSPKYCLVFVLEVRVAGGVSSFGLFSITSNWFPLSLSNW